MEAQEIHPVVQRWATPIGPVFREAHDFMVAVAEDLFTELAGEEVRAALAQPNPPEHVRRTHDAMIRASATTAQNIIGYAFMLATAILARASGDPEAEDAVRELVVELSESIGIEGAHSIALDVVERHLEKIPTEGPLTLPGTLHPLTPLLREALALTVRDIRARPHLRLLPAVEMFDQADSVEVIDLPGREWVLEGEFND